MGKTTYAGLAVLLAISWQFLTVSVNYGGNWTALFCTGGNRPIPPELVAENIYVFDGSDGFDGQFYHYIAHEPVPRGRISHYVEAAQMRYRRILLPALAYLSSFGNARLLHFAYIGWGMVFLFLGTWWLGKYLESTGQNPAWCLLFPLLPASVVFVDRLTVDHCLAALTVAFAFYSARRPGWKLYTVLVLAPLVRETGLALIAAYCVYLFSERKWKQAAVYATAGLPWLGWAVCVRFLASGHGYRTTLIPLGSLLHWLTHPIHYPPGVPLVRLVQLGDAAALLGLLLAIGLGFYLGIRRRFEPVATAALLFAMAAMLIQGRGLWHSAYSFGRVFSPLLLLVALSWLPSKRWLAVAPLVLILPRVLMQYGRQVTGIAAAVFGS